MTSNNRSRKVLFVVLLLVIIGVLVYVRNTPREDLGAIAIGGVRPSTTVPVQGECPTNTSLTVLSPNGGEKYQSGQQVTVKWDNCGIHTTFSVSIDLIQTNAATTSEGTKRLVVSTANDGSEVVTLPTTATWPSIGYGNNFILKVRYILPDRTIVEDVSNQKFTISDLKVVMGVPSYNRTTNASGQVTSVTYNIPLSVTAMGSTLYLGQAATLAETTGTSQSFALVFQNSNTPLVSDLMSSGVVALASSDATIENTAFRLEEGTTKHFNVVVTLLSPTVQNSSYRVALKKIQAFYSPLNMAPVLGFSVPLVPDSAYRTDYQLINN